MAPRRSWVNADNPFWSNHVAAWYRSELDAEHYCRKHDLSTASLMGWARHLLSADDLHKRAEDLQKLRRKEPRRQPKNGQSNTPKRPRRNRYSVRTDSGPVALQAFWGMHIEAMNWSGMGHAEYAAALGLSPHALRIWRDRLEQSGNEMDWRSLLHPSARAQLSSAANHARTKYRLTPEATDGRSNRRRFSEEQKRAIVQETEKPGASVAKVCRGHGIATSMVFRWRVDFGLSAQKAPQVATVALSEGAANEPSALAVLRDLARPPDGMMAIKLDDGRCVFAPADSCPAAVKRQLANREKTS
jgi:transposase-like protein